MTAALRGKVLFPVLGYSRGGHLEPRESGALSGSRSCFPDLVQDCREQRGGGTRSPRAAGFGRPWEGLHSGFCSVPAAWLACSCHWAAPWHPIPPFLLPGAMAPASVAADTLSPPPLASATWPPTHHACAGQELRGAWPWGPTPRVAGTEVLAVFSAGWADSRVQGALPCGWYTGGTSRKAGSHR